MALVDEYEAAVRGGNTQYANYLAQILASGAGININANQVTAAPASMLPDRSGSSAGGGSFWGGLQTGLDAIGQGFAHPFDTLTGKNTATMDAQLKSGQGGLVSGIGSIIGGVSDAVSGTSAAIKFITDIPRVATTILGLILIIAGIFALARGPTVQIVGSAVKEAVTS